jgi:hypothetical protein
MMNLWQIINKKVEENLIVPKLCLNSQILAGALNWDFLCIVFNYPLNYSISIHEIPWNNPQEMNSEKEEKYMAKKSCFLFIKISTNNLCKFIALSKGDFPIIWPNPC